ncbi:MAG: ISAzo13-like element transposase-related protein [Methylococcales bacterium]
MNPNGRGRSGSNGYRLRLWKYELQKLANNLGLTIRVCHFPPGTSKWNKIEHRLFSFISRQIGVEGH